MYIHTYMNYLYVRLFKSNSESVLAMLLYTVKTNIKINKILHEPISNNGNFVKFKE